MDGCLDVDALVIVLVVTASEGFVELAALRGNCDENGTLTARKKVLSNRRVIRCFNLNRMEGTILSQLSRDAKTFCSIAVVFFKRLGVANR